MPSSQHIWMALSCGVFLCAMTAGVAAQPQSRSAQMPVPPPMRFVSPSERAQLNADRDPKSRVRTSIGLAVDHLARAEDLTSQKKYEQASEELGSYLGLIDDAMASIGSRERKLVSTRDL